MIALTGMVFFTGLHLWRLPRRKILHVDLQEAKRWLQVIEYCIWFIAYVWVVPNLGYLISTIIFLPALAYRAGYQNKNDDLPPVLGLALSLFLNRSSR